APCSKAAWDLLMDHVFQFVSTYGYVGLYLMLMLGIVGLPIPDETLLVFSGYLISKGTLQPVPTLLTALSGSATGITVSYVLGRTLGLGVIHRFGKYLHVTDARLAMVHRWFDRTGHWALVAGYFIAGVRHLTAILAGTSKLSYRSFALFAYGGALIWASLFLSIGYFFGEKWREIADLMEHYLLWISVAVLTLAAIYLLIWYRRRKLRAL
ncbi:MAG: DedA family protein, partial [Bryobacteraceae bacterium]